MGDGSPACGAGRQSGKLPEEAAQAERREAESEVDKGFPGAGRESRQGWGTGETRKL